MDSAQYSVLLSNFTHIYTHMNKNERVEEEDSGMALYKLLRKRDELKRDLERVNDELGPCPACFCLWRRRRTRSETYRTYPERGGIEVYRVIAIFITMILCLMAAKAIWNHSMFQHMCLSMVWGYGTLCEICTTITKNLPLFDVISRYGLQIVTFALTSLVSLITELYRKLKDHYDMWDDADSVNALRSHHSDDVCKRIREISAVLKGAQWLSASVVPGWLSDGVASHRCKETISDPEIAASIVRMYAYAFAIIGTAILSANCILKMAWVLFGAPLVALWVCLVTWVCFLENALRWKGDSRVPRLRRRCIESDLNGGGSFSPRGIVPFVGGV